MFRKAAVVIVAALALACAGCGTYRGGTITEGRTFQAGIKTPAGEAVAMFQVVSYLNGFVFSWEANSAVTLKRTTTEKFSALGIWEDDTTSESEITLTPCTEEPDPEPEPEPAPAVL